MNKKNPVISFIFSIDFKQIVMIILILANITFCKIHFVRNSKVDDLTGEEIKFLQSKKIGLIGFHPLISDVSFSDSNPNSSYIIDDINFQKIVLFTNQNNQKIKIDSRKYIEYQKGSKGAYTISDLDSKSTTDFLNFGKRINEITSSGKNLKINDESIRNFISSYHSHLNYLSFPEIKSLFEFSNESKDKNKIKNFEIKNFDVDYWIVGIHKHEGFNKGVPDFPYAINFFISVFSLFTIPSFDKETQSSIFIVYDKELNLVQEINIKNDLYVMLAWWCGFLNSGKRNISPEIEVYEPDMKEFSKLIVNKLKK